ncbi:uncharacterized protein LOC144298133 [Canis aureus]
MRVWETGQHPCQEWLAFLFFLQILPWVAPVNHSVSSQMSPPGQLCLMTQGGCSSSCCRVPMVAIGKDEGENEVHAFPFKGHHLGSAHTTSTPVHWPELIHSGGHTQLQKWLL